MRRAKPLLGTVVEIGISNSAHTMDEKTVHTAIHQAFQSIQTVHDVLSFHSQTSELTRLNTHPGEWVPMRPLALRVLRLARGLMVRTHNTFNCTCAGELVKNGRLPNPYGQGHTAAILLKGSAADLELSAHQAKLNRPVLITLDGIAKGFAVDQAIRALMRWQLPGGWVNAGGDLRVFGDTSLSVSLRRPTHFTQTITVRNEALASSQIGQKDDSRFPGMIVGDIADTSDLISIRAMRAWKADALTKVAACTPRHERAAWLRRCQAREVYPHEIS